VAAGPGLVQGSGESCRMSGREGGREGEREGANSKAVHCYRSCLSASPLKC
jgi:hypothetical protein